MSKIRAVILEGIVANYLNWSKERKKRKFERTIRKSDLPFSDRGRASTLANEMKGEEKDYLTKREEVFRELKKIPDIVGKKAIISGVRPTKVVIAGFFEDVESRGYSVKVKKILGPGRFSKVFVVAPEVLQVL